MPKQVSSTPPNDSIVDSVILHYFLLVDRLPLLTDLLGAPLRVPRIVYDPDEEPGTPPLAMSEMRRAVDFHQRRANDKSRPLEVRADYRKLAENLASVESLHRAGTIEIIDMTDDELRLYGSLTSAEHLDRFGLRFPLDAGEAACVAIAHERRWTIATDDGDALTALRSLSPRHPYERIRKLLVRAAQTALISEDEANSIHAEMTRRGFWDGHRPFPKRT